MTEPVDRVENDITLELSVVNNQTTARLLDRNNKLLAEETIEIDNKNLQSITVPLDYCQSLSASTLTGDIAKKLGRFMQGRLRVNILEGLVDFQDLRWECLNHPSIQIRNPFPTIQATPFSRLLNLPIVRPNKSPKINWPIQVLIAVSNPADLNLYGLSEVDPKKEQAELLRALKPLQGLISITFLEPPVSLDRICQTLEELDTIDILHFLGHGSYNKTKGISALFLEKESDLTVDIVTQEEWFNRLLSIKNLPRLLILTACESAAKVHAGVLVGIAPKMVEAGIGAVLAMQGKIGIDVAREFNFHFYRRLATHGVIDQAANEARGYLLDWGGWSWSHPTLYLERGAERLFLTPPEALEDRPARQGEILILIPEFHGHEEAYFEVDLRDRLLQRINHLNLKGVRVVWLRKSGFGPGDEDKVRQLAARYGATLVIWGWYDRSRFQACFTQTDTLFNFCLPGTSDIESSIRSYLQSDQDFAIIVNNKLPQQVDYFVFFTLGRLNYWEQNYLEAEKAFSQAIESVEDEPWNDALAGQSLAYFYRGNIKAVHHQDRQAAISDYKSALAIKPDFVEAAYNLGEAFRVLANTFRRDNDETSAQRTYQEAITAYRTAVESNTEYAVAYEGRGLAYYEIGDFESAILDYQQALSLWPRAETHHQLGLTLRNLDRGVEALEQLNQAITRAPGIGRYYFSRGRIRLQQGDEPGAVADLQTYLQLAPDDDPSRNHRVRSWLAKRG